MRPTGRPPVARGVRDAYARAAAHVLELARGMAWRCLTHRIVS